MLDISTVSAEERLKRDFADIYLESGLYKYFPLLIDSFHCLNVAFSSGLIEKHEDCVHDLSILRKRFDSQFYDLFFEG